MIIAHHGASRTGQSGSRIEGTWLTPTSQWLASSSMPHTLILKGAMGFTALVMPPASIAV
jgi:hypothetical protein